MGTAPSEIGGRRLGRDSQAGRAAGNHQTAAAQIGSLRRVDLRLEIDDLLKQFLGGPGLGLLMIVPQPEAQCLNGSLQLDSLRGDRLTRHMCIDPQREELIREELGRIVASDLFCRSDRLCRFLRFSVEQALRGESDRVKEYVVRGSERQGPLSGVHELSAFSLDRARAVEPKVATPIRGQNYCRTAAVFP